MDQLTSMRLFVRVVQTGSFTGVARESGFSQSSVSKHLAALEAVLGTRLLSRTSRKLSLTEVGSEYYERCLNILADVDEAQSAATSMVSNPNGTLRVSAPVAFGQRHIIPHMPNFLQNYPDIKLNIMMMDRQVDLVADGIDVAIRIGALEDSALIAKRLGDSPRLVVASKTYLDTHGRPDHPDDLKDHNCLVYSLLSTMNVWHYQQEGKKSAVQVNGTFQANNSDAVLQMALAGCGIMIMPKWMSGTGILDGQLEAILTNYTFQGVPIQAVYLDKRYVPSKVSSFVSFLKNLYASDPLLHDIHRGQIL